MKKLNINIILISLITLVSCGNNSVNNEEESHGHDAHDEEGVVFLSQKQQKALNLSLGSIQMRNLTTVVKTNGQLEIPPNKKADITAIVGGNVKTIAVFVGDKVKKGQILATLEHPDYIKFQEDFAVVANNLEFLKQEYNRQKELYDNNVGSGKDFQKAKADYNTAKAQYQGLKSRLQLLNLSPNRVKGGTISNTINIISPISGFVNSVNIKLGTYVDAKDIMFEVADNSEIHADFLVYEKDIHLLKVGQKIHFTVSNRPNEEFMATVFAIGKRFDPNTRAVNIHANITGSVNGLISGMYITGHLHTDKNYVQALPSDAIVTEGAKSYIFIIDEGIEEEHEHKHNEAEEEHNEEHGHEDADEIHENEKTGFKMVEVITGKKDAGYTEVHLVDSISESAKIVLNAAYYLLADINKDETEHKH